MKLTNFSRKSILCTRYFLPSQSLPGCAGSNDGCYVQRSSHGPFHSWKKSYLYSPRRKASLASVDRFSHESREEALLNTGECTLHSENSPRYSPIVFNTVESLSFDQVPLDVAHVRQRKMRKIVLNFGMVASPPRNRRKSDMKFDENITRKLRREIKK